MALDLARFREKLLARREELVAEDRMSEADRAPVVLEQDSVGRLSRIDAMQVQAMALAQARRRQTERAAIDAALRRIDDGEFGYCLKCGDDIAPARLEHNPAVTSCIDCAKES
ncbi:TraR/DksA family transcriptional regulator [Sphingobium fuliginis]|uniref:DnaK suppressor protein n=1 Tax=Sphingobium fuliginis (strain ATCC 27551) TaxID=336203 RepID=A0A292Z918_SPHSA|nr:TraR/DksA C4-type zinc finger protein [Sphingobium fuliginis]GAY20097.1 DnaK suppressor protein [Sphingobium fuliginis]